jgi:hypothetical protein
MRPANILTLVGAGLIVSAAATDLPAQETVRPTPRPVLPANKITVRFDCRPVSDAIPALQAEGYRPVAGWTDVDGDRWLLVATEDGRAFFGVVWQGDICTIAAQAGQGS